MREGGTIDVDPSCSATRLVTIDSLGFYTGSGNDVGDPSGFNDSGLVAFSATFVGGGSGVFVSDLVAAAGLPGDFNANGIVDAADYVLWRKGLGTTDSQSDYTVWRSTFGQTAASGASLNNGSAVRRADDVSLCWFWECQHYIGLPQCAASANSYEGIFRRSQ